MWLCAFVCTNISLQENTITVLTLLHLASSTSMHMSFLDAGGSPRRKPEHQEESTVEQRGNRVCWKVCQRHKMAGGKWWGARPVERVPSDDAQKRLMTRDCPSATLALLFMLNPQNRKQEIIHSLNSPWTVPGTRVSGVSPRPTSVHPPRITGEVLCIVVGTCHPTGTQHGWLPEVGCNTSATSLLLSQMRCPWTCLILYLASTLSSQVSRLISWWAESYQPQRKEAESATCFYVTETFLFCKRQFHRTKIIF